MPSRPEPATFVTITLATDKTETGVFERIGSDGHVMIERYRRKVRTWNLGEREIAHLYATPRSRSLRPLNLRLGLPHEFPTDSPHGWRNWQTQRI